VRIVPILCGPFAADPFVPSPDIRPDVAPFLAACRRIVAPEPKRFTVIAGADLAHVGRRFGDPFEIDAGVVRRVRGRDKEDLARVTDADPEGFYRSVMKDGNERKVCGLACIYAALKTVEGSAGKGEILHYAYAPDPLGGIVSFAGVSLPALG
jgi:hypothetical protein